MRYRLPQRPVRPTLGGPSWPASASAKTAAPGYQVPYRDPTGVQRARRFVRKPADEQPAANVEKDETRGSYIDPKAGRITLQDYGAARLSAQLRPVHSRGRRAAVPATRLPDHWDDQASGAATVAGARWLRRLRQVLAPRYVRVIVANPSAVLAAAVDDERIVRKSCRAQSVKSPAA